MLSIKGKVSHPNYCILINRYCDSYMGYSAFDAVIYFCTFLSGNW